MGVAVTTMKDRNRRNWMDREEGRYCGGGVSRGHPLVCVRCCEGTAAEDEQSMGEERPSGAEVLSPTGYRNLTKGAKANARPNWKLNGVRGCY